MNAAIDPSARLERALRFADLAINAAAVPLPVNLIPSAVPQDIEDDAAVGEAADSAHAEQAQPDIGPQRNAASAELPLPIEQIVPDDAVVRSLQAAVDAVRESLHDGPDSRILPQDAGDLADADAASIPNITQSTTPLAASISVALVADDGATTDHGASASAGLLAAATPLASTPLASPLLSNVALAQPDFQQDVAPVLRTVDAAVANVTDAATAALNGLLDGTPADLGAVTIPSLGGLGLDAMAGLLQPAVVAADLSHALDPALTSLQDMPVFAAIGASEVIHADQELAHATHSVLHLVGSGLI